MTNSLPQDNSPEYKYNYDAFWPVSQKSPDQPNLQYPMAAEVFYEDNSLTKKDWAAAVASTLVRVRTNQTLYDVEIERKPFATLKLIFDIKLLRFIENPEDPGLLGGIYKFLLAILKNSSNVFKKSPKGKTARTPLVTKIFADEVKSIQNQEKRQKKMNEALSIKSYQEIFQIIYLPNIARYELDDKIFAAQRVAGANPLVIKRLEGLMANFPVTDIHYQAVMGNDDDLEKALREKRLYITDYQCLQDLNYGQVEIDNQQVPKFIYQPIALFAVEPGNYPNRRLIPVAIQCYQQPSPKNPIFTPPTANATESERWAWKIAKLTVQIADGNYHEFISHLGGTHLWMEPIAIAIYRKLPASHPLGALLRPHIEGTLFINDSAVKGLVNNGGTVDKVAAGTLSSSILLSVKGAKGYPFAFKESALPKTLQSRGVDDPNYFPDYPFRDDALLIWEAINDWVTNYLKLFYLDDLAVQNDPGIQTWIKDLADPAGGQMPSISESTSSPQINTLEYLIEVVTIIIFTGSAQHAAVNFPQSALMTYMPNMPLAGYQAAPQKTTGLSETDYFELLPPLSQAEIQLNMTYLLGSIYYTQLGIYGDEYFINQNVIELLEKFQKRLESIEQEIHDRNQVRLTYYDTLLPSKIPQSINI
jgi:arachidonate 15-lipoxygenase